MTLRFDPHGKPVGLNWSLLTDGSWHPEVWTDWRPPKPRAKADNTTVEEEARTPKPTRLRLSAATERQIISKYTDDRLSALEIAAQLGIRPSTVYKVLRRRGVPTRSRSESMRMSKAKRHAAA